VQPKVNKVNNFLLFLKLGPIPNLLGQKKSKFIIRSNFIVRSKVVAEEFFLWSTFYQSYNNRCWYAFASSVKSDIILDFLRLLM